MPEEKIRGAAWRWRCAALVLIFLVLCLVIALVVAIVLLSKTTDEENVDTCGTAAENTIDLSEPSNPNPFHRLTRKEMRGILSYLSADESLNLVKPENYVLNSTYIYFGDVLPQPKVEVLNFLDNEGPEPTRVAKVVLFRGDNDPPVVEEIEVGPLPNPTYHKRISYNNKRRNPVDFSFRPVSYADIGTLIDITIAQIDRELGDILLENYGAKFVDCGDTCLEWYLSFISSGLTKTKTRLMWLWLAHGAEFFLVQPLDMAILIDMTSSDPSKHFTKEVWYMDKLYDSISDFKWNYVSPNGSIPRIPFPKVDRNYFSTMNLRGNPQPSEPKSGPRAVEPDGKRYTIKHQHISYLGWEFNYRLNTQTGPQMFDIRYSGERIAYEISLQEISVFYSGYSPNQRHADYVDSVLPMARNARTLIPGADCPRHATFMENVILLEGFSEPVTYKHGACVFEHDNGIPMRRHSSYETARGSRFYAGMPDNVLVVRTIIVVSNYDYVTDFIFHQGGALEVRVASTGYISSSMYSAVTAKYGFPLHGRMSGTVHHHMFHFKADVDIAGTENRFETLDVKLDTVSNRPWSNENYVQTRIETSLKATEEEAAYKFNFDTPKYLLFRNHNSTTKTGIPRSYRLNTVGMSKQILPEDVGNEPTVSWSRYQVAVTRQHDDEPSSSSSSAMTDASQPVVSFQSFISDNEDIVDKDLVAWVSLGVQHIPHTEDLPVTPTVGGHLQFFLLPYNYFDEDASMSSRDAIRVEFEDPQDMSKGVKVERYGNAENKQCYVPKTDFDEAVNKDPTIALSNE